MLQASKIGRTGKVGYPPCRYPGSLRLRIVEVLKVVKVFLDFL
jgi:hypothetical protein